MDRDYEVSPKQDDPDIVKTYVPPLLPAANRSMKESSQSMHAEQEAIRKAGFKLTQPRVLVLKILCASRETGERLGAEEIFRRIIRSKSISLAGVYHVLSQFEEAGLVVRHQSHTSFHHSVYELAEDTLVSPSPTSTDHF